MNWLQRMMKVNRREPRSTGTDDGGLSIGGNLDGPGHIIDLIKRRKYHVHKKNRFDPYRRKGESPTKTMQQM